MKHKIARQKEVPVYHVVQQFLNAKCEKKACARAAANLKYDVTGSVLWQSLETLFKVSPHYEKLLWGNLFPLSVEELGEGNSYFFKSSSIIGDFNWLYIQVSNHKKLISYYVEIRNDVEKAILLGNYDKAITLLEELKEKCGVSVWFYEMKLLIYSYSGNERKSLELLTEINEKKKESKHGFVAFLLSYLYKRCSKNYSAYAYDSELGSKFRMNRTEFQKDRYIYYLLRLNFYKSYKAQDMTPALIMEATNSLIDRYNLFTYIVKAYFANCQNEFEKKTVSDIATRFYRKTNDSWLHGIVAYSNMKCIGEPYFNADYLRTLDLYYRGNYTECIDSCKHFINNNIPIFDLIKIYCRSLIARNQDYVPICKNRDAILNQLALNLYKTMTVPDNDEFINLLYQINKNIYGLNIAGGLHHYLFSEENEVDSIMRYMTCLYFDPLYSNIYDTTEYTDEYLKFGRAKLGYYSIVEYQERRNRGDVYGATEIVDYIKNVDSAKISFAKDEFQKALSLWKTVLEENSNILPIVQCAIDYIFKCCIKLGNKQDAITFFVENYIKGKAYTNRIDTSEVIETMYLEKFKIGVRNGLDLQLFVFINANEDEKKSALLERFCNYKDVDNVSDLVHELDYEFSNNRDKVELYLYMLASEDILRHMVYITSTKKMLEEQQKIAQFLTTLSDSPNIEKYNMLNQEILDTMIIYQNIRKIDDSKIYVNQNALIKYEFAEYEGLYNQFKIQFENSGATNSFYVVNSVSDWTDINKDSSLIHTQVKFTSKAFIDSACQVFTMLRDKFLFSKFGLKTYLSTRIRHGVLEGVLRSGYDSLHLLLTTENNKYMPTKYWLIKYGLTQTEQDCLMRMLGKFSSGVSQTIEAFKEDALQIKTEDIEKGMFDYRLTPDEMCYATVWSNTKAEDYEHFCLLIMEYLLKMANRSLISIRNAINTNLKNSFNRLVDNLSQDIQVFSERHFFDDLNNAVNSARTDTVKKIAHIEKWFYLQDAKFENFSLVDQMRAVWQITAKMYPNIEAKLELISPNEDIIIKSMYVIHISDMLTIFYNNMFSYSKVEPQRPFKIEMAKEGDNVRICFENNIDEDEDRLNERFKEMLQLDSRLQMEGRSGLVKVKKIIQAELGHEHNRLEIIAKEGKCKATVVINLKAIRI